MTIRILVVDDQALIRAGLRALIDSEEDLEVVGEAVDGLEAVAMAHRCRADVILMDIRMPGLDGIEATRQITTNQSLAGVRILILTTFELDENVLLALRAGASGFLGKGSSPGELLAAVRTVAAGEALLSPKATQTLIRQYLALPQHDTTTSTEERLSVFAVLTSREREVVTMVAQGQTNDDIARHFFVSPVTVKTHLNRAMTKLNTRDRAQLVILAFHSGLVRPD